LRAQAERALAEAEAVRLRNERNRLLRLAIMAWALAGIAVLSAVFGLLALRKAEDNRRAAVAAEQKAGESKPSQPR
jgi:hypothetical protein